MKKILLGFAMLFGGPAFAQIPANGLIASYPFTNNATDVSGNNNHGNNSGATLTTDRFGKSNAAYDFSAAGHIDFNNVFNGAFAGTGKKFSISFWVKPSASNTSNIILAKHADAGCSANERQFFIRQYNDQINVEYFGNNSGTTGRFVCGSTVLTNTTKWYHVVVTYDGTVNTNNGLDRIGIYVNNQAETTTLSCRGQAGSFPFDITSGQARFAVGNYLNNSGMPCLTNTRYNGKIDDIKIYDRLLNANEIGQLFFETQISGIGTFPENTAIKIYPNPATDQFTIDFGNQSKLKSHTIKITNSIGQTVFTSLINQQSITLSASDWTGKGLYFAYTINEQGEIIEVRKILVN